MLRVIADPGFEEVIRRAQVRRRLLRWCDD